MKDNTLVGKPLTIITKLTPETRKELKELTSDIVESLK